MYIYLCILTCLGAWLAGTVDCHLDRLVVRRDLRGRRVDGNSDAEALAWKRYILSQTGTETLLKQEEQHGSGETETRLKQEEQNGSGGNRNTFEAGGATRFRRQQKHV